MRGEAATTVSHTAFEACPYLALRAKSEIKRKQALMKRLIMEGISLYRVKTNLISCSQKKNCFTPSKGYGCNFGREK